MNKNELAAVVANKTGLSKGDAAKAVDAMLEGVVESLQKGEEIRLVGFGTFSAYHRATSQGRNPGRHGAQIQGRQGAEGSAQLAVEPSRPAGRAVRSGGPGTGNSRRPSHVRERLPAALRKPGARTIFCPSTKSCQRAVSSAGRAPRLHRGGRRFEPVTAHQLNQ